MDRYRKRRFAKNLDALLRSRCVTRKEAAADAKVPYQWLRRAVSEGISRPDKRSKGHLDALARYLGLTTVERLWAHDLYVPPPPSSIKHEADRLAELMREYTLIAGIEDELLREIDARIAPVVRGHQEREKKLHEEQERRRSLEESMANIANSIEKKGGSEGPASWRERQERARGKEEEQRQASGDRARAFREADKRNQAVVQALGLFRSEFTERWQAIGLPRVEEVDLPAAEVVPYAVRHNLDTFQELAPHVSDLWMAKYAQVQGMTPHEARDFIHRFLSAAYGIVWEQDPRGTPKNPHTDVPGDQVGPSSIKDGAARLGELMRTYVSEVGVEDATLQGIAMQIREAIWKHQNPDPDRPRPGKYSRLLSSRLLSKAATNQPPPQVPPQRLSLAAELAAARLAMGLAEVAASNQGKPTSPDHPAPPEASPGRLPSPEARTSARQRVAHVLTSLSPEQSEFFLGEYPCAAEAEKYVEDQLFSRIRGGRMEYGGPLPAQAPDEALRAVIAEIVEDHDRACHTRSGSDSDYLSDEPITLEEKSLDVRHGELTQEDKVDQRGVPLPVGSALEAEIASSLAEDRAAVRHVDDFLENLGETPVPSGKGTYLEHIKRLDNPRSVAKVALSEAGGNTGKALEWIIDKVDKSIEGERAQADAMRQAKPHQGRKKAPAKGKRSKKEGRPVEMSPEDFRRLVTVGHEDGLSVRDIITTLQDDVEDVPEWVRRAGREELARMIRDIIAQNEPEDDGADPDEFDAQAQDDLKARDFG